MDTSWMGDIKQCPQCGKYVDGESLYSKHTLYKVCIDCRRKYVREKQAARRERMKQVNQLSAKERSIHRDKKKLVMAYLTQQAGNICNPCGWKKRTNGLTMLHPDGLLSHAVAEYVESMNRDSWAAVVEAYRESVPVCGGCYMAYHDTAFELQEINYEKNENSPKAYHEIYGMV